MRLKEIETRVVRLERARGKSRLDCMSEEGIDREVVACLEILMGPGIFFADLIAEMAASEEPDIREGAKLAVQYIGARYGYHAAPEATQ